MPNTGSGRHDRAVNAKLMLWIAAMVITFSLLISFVRNARSAHESTNILDFAPVADSSAPLATGDGVIDFRGGTDENTRWTARFHFLALEPNARYVVVVKGRYGEDDSPEAEAFSPLCEFETDASGTGNCWWYHLGLQRIGVVQLRDGNQAGPVILQATRKPGGPGTIVSTPNAFSPSPSATPATPVGTPPSG